ncbi:MAG: prepilin-type N-terminal cleavage/methylation domain-containing protein [Lachnospiraceae bacterium]|nr:prepilin-type N-terminal cleavage/methylation domain-containing protein [Lachnospiraceae bacterium]
MHMRQKKNKGFTMAELLIVVAIIAVLVAVAIPIFNSKLETSREAYDIATMRQAASLATQFYYDGVVDEASANKAGLKWWKNDGKNQANAAGIYNPSTGTFTPKQSNESGAPAAYGKGTSTDTEKEYTFNGDRKFYNPAADYSNGVVLVSIYPLGDHPHIDVYWKDRTSGEYIGGKNGANDPAYSIRININ